MSGRIVSDRLTSEAASDCESSDESVMGYSFDIAPPDVPQKDWDKMKVDMLIDNIAKLNIGSGEPSAPPLQLIELAGVENAIVEQEHQKNIERLRGFQMEMKEPFHFCPHIQDQANRRTKRQTRKQSYFVGQRLEGSPLVRRPSSLPNVMLPPPFEAIPLPTESRLISLEQNAMTHDAPQNRWFETISNVLAPEPNGPSSSKTWYSAIADSLPSIADSLPSIADSLPAIADSLPSPLRWFSSKPNDKIKTAKDFLSAIEAGEMTGEIDNFQDDDQVVIQMPRDVEQGLGEESPEEVSRIRNLIPTDAKQILENVGNASASVYEKCRKKFVGLWFQNRLEDPVDERPDQRV